MWKRVFDIISSSIGRSFKATRTDSVGGGCINEAFRVSDGSSDFFVKRHHESMADMFEATEAVPAAPASCKTDRRLSPRVDREGTIVTSSWVASGHRPQRVASMVEPELG